eukprot:760000-Hanusia_phi.AAC.3
MAGSPALAKIAPELSRASSLGSIDVISTRIWLDRYVVTQNPANVLSKFEGEEEEGMPGVQGLVQASGGQEGRSFCSIRSEVGRLREKFLTCVAQLQPDQRALWGGEEAQGSVLACDFYNAGGLLPLSEKVETRGRGGGRGAVEDQERGGGGPNAGGGAGGQGGRVFEGGSVEGGKLMVGRSGYHRLAHEGAAPCRYPRVCKGQRNSMGLTLPADKVQVVDSHVQKYPGAVTWFSPGSYTSRPPLK